MNTDFDSYWGIDVSKEWLDIAIGHAVTRIEQTEEAISNFIKDKQIYTENALAVLESTGGFEKLASRCLSKNGITVHIAHPNRVKAFAKAKGRLAKTDKIDAKLLSEYGRFIEIDAIRALPSKKQEEMQLLGARLEQLKEMYHQERCRLGMACIQSVKASHELILSLLEKEIESLEAQILKLIKEDTELTEKYKLLRSMKGVGPVLAMVLIIDLPELGTINKKEVAALVGVAPITNQSGIRTGKALTRYGRHEIRKKLYMAALSASRHNKKMKEFYERLVKAGKEKKVALVAVMRKMIVILNAMMSTKTCFNG